MSNVTIWHNPRCSKSRATLALLEERGLTPDIRTYQSDPPGEDEIRAALAALGLAASAIIRRGEPVFKELGLTAGDDPDRLIAAMAAHPILIERPIVFAGNRAAIGRPPEAVLDIL